MPGGFRNRGRRNGRGRRLCVLEPLVLLLLAEAPSHGYRLIEQLATRFGVEMISPQTVYRALQGLAEQGWIEADWVVEGTQGPPRKVYRTTTAGEETLDLWSAELTNLSRTLENFQQSYRTLRKKS